MARHCVNPLLGGENDVACPVLLPPCFGAEGAAGSPVPVVSLPAEDGRRRRPPAGWP